jgi:RHS repeat-associated protein
LAVRRPAGPARPHRHAGHQCRGRPLPARPEGRVSERQRARISGQPAVWSYQWDADDRLTSVTTPDGVIWRYRYDPLGRRIAKQRFDPSGAVLAEETTFTWDGAVLAEETTFTWDGAVLAEETTFTWDGAVLAEETAFTRDGAARAEETTFTWEGGVLAEETTFTRDDPGRAEESASTRKLGCRRRVTWDYRPGTFTPLTQSQSTSSGDAPQSVIDERFYAIVADQVGMPAEVIAANGTVAGHQQHTLWGGTLWRPGGAATPLRFPGQYHDPETGLHYNQQRYYDPVTGSYLTPGPARPGPRPEPARLRPQPAHPDRPPRPHVLWPEYPGRS